MAWPCRDGLPIPDCDLQLVIVVDQSASSITSEAKQWLHQLQQQHLHKVRVRFNKQNMGASATRNTALQVSMIEKSVDAVMNETNIICVIVPYNGKAAFPGGARHILYIMLSKCLVVSAFAFIACIIWTPTAWQGQRCVTSCNPEFCCNARP